MRPGVRSGWISLSRGCAGRPKTFRARMAEPPARGRCRPSFTDRLSRRPGRTFAPTPQCATASRRRFRLIPASRRKLSRFRLPVYPARHRAGPAYRLASFIQRNRGPKGIPAWFLGTHPLPAYHISCVSLTGSGCWTFRKRRWRAPATAASSSDFNSLRTAI